MVTDEDKLNEKLKKYLVYFKDIVGEIETDFIEIGISAPQTFYDMLENKVERVIERIYNEKGAELYNIFLEQNLLQPLISKIYLHADASINKLIEEVTSDPVSTSLYNLVIKAHKVVPFSPLFAFDPIYSDNYGFHLGIVEPAYYIQNIEDKIGEVTSRNLKNAYVNVPSRITFPIKRQSVSNFKTRS
jgi:hypothetical protein